MAPSTLETTHLLLQPPNVQFAQQTLEFVTRNRTFFQSWVPLRDETYFTLPVQKAILEEKTELFRAGQAYRFFLFPKAHPAMLIGEIGFSNVIRGAFWSCFLGFQIDEGYANQGLMTAALEEGIRFVFVSKGLHRIEANVMPHNQPSIRVLEKLGFEREGLARDYLKINGRWEDHVHYAKLNGK